MNGKLLLNFHQVAVYNVFKPNEARNLLQDAQESGDPPLKTLKALHAVITGPFLIGRLLDAWPGREGFFNTFPTWWCCFLRHVGQILWVGPTYPPR